jgi:hypothetical protein
MQHTRNRFSRAARIVLHQISDLPQPARASYDTLSALTGYDPDTIRVSIRMLERNRLIVKTRGRGGRPNAYKVLP